MDKQAEYHPDESFRDSVSTISKEGRRSWIYAQRPKGKFYTARSIVSIFYLILFFSLPFVRVHGDPFFLFNILERRFVFFGVTFWPQDFFLFGIGMLSSLFSLSFLRLFSGAYFVAGSVLRLFSWKWSFVESNIGSKEMQRIKSN